MLAERLQCVGFKSLFEYKYRLLEIVDWLCYHVDRTETNLVDPRTLSAATLGVFFLLRIIRRC